MDGGRLRQKERRRYQSFMVRIGVVRQITTTNDQTKGLVYLFLKSAMYGVHTIHDIYRPHLISSANKVNTKVRDLVLEKDFQFPPLRSGYRRPFYT